MDRRAVHNRIQMGVITGAHGLRGLVRVKSLASTPADVAAHGALTDESGAGEYRLSIKGTGPKGLLLAAVDGVTDRNGAEALKGVKLFIDRDRLPPPEEDEYYASDLIGLNAELADGTVLGRIHAVQDFGAGDLIEIRHGPVGSVLVPFTEACVPVVDLAGGRLVMDPPPGLLEPPTDEERAAAKASEMVEAES